MFFYFDFLQWFKNTVVKDCIYNSSHSHVASLCGNMLNKTYHIEIIISKTRARDVTLCGESKKVFELLVSKTRIFDNGFQGVRIEALMIRYCYSVNPIRHAYVFTSGYNPKVNFTECPYCSLCRDVSKKHFRQTPLPDKQWNVGFLLQSYGGRL